MQACSRQLAQTRLVRPVFVKTVAPSRTLRAAVSPFQSARPNVAGGARGPVVVSAAAAAAEAVEVTPEAPAGARDGICHMRFQRGAVNKVRRILDVLRGRSYEEALILCEYMPYAACEKIIKCLMSAAANAKHNKGALKAKLFVSECYADVGPQLKRMRPRAQGRGFKIIKGTFHLTIKVEERA